MHTAMKEIGWKRGKFGILVFICQAAFIIIFGCLVDYGWDATPASRRDQFMDVKSPDIVLKPPPSGKNVSTPPVEQRVGRENFLIPKTPVEGFYAMFQDVHVMIFIGFGFLVTFLNKYSYGGLGFTFLIGAFVLQWASIMRGFYRLSENNWRIRLDLVSLVSADFTAGTVLITLGVILGKLSPIQYVVMLMLEVPLITVSEWICYDIFLIKDAGGTITIHMFGAFFGLALARTLNKKEWASEEFAKIKGQGTKYNELFSLLGSIFLWMFWPSFNACTAVEDGRYRAVYNTYFSIAASCLGAFMTCSFTKKEKFTMDIIQNSTLAGGVVVGSICDMYLYPYGALICGFGIGIISALGFSYLSEILDTKLGCHDTCGVNNLHAMPSFVGAFLSVIVAGCATKEVYGSGYYTQFPAHAPPADSPDFPILQAQYPDLKAGYGWTPRMQACYQLAAIAVTLGISIVGGILTGIILRLPLWNAPTSYEVYGDHPYWEISSAMTDDEENQVRSHLDRLANGIHTYDQGHTNVVAVGMVEKESNGRDLTHRHLHDS